MLSYSKPQFVVLNTTNHGLSNNTYRGSICFMKEIRENLKRLRESKSLSQSELAELCGFDGGKKSGQTRISNYEVGSRKIGVDDLITFANALDAGLEELLPVGSIKVTSGPKFSFLGAQEPQTNCDATNNSAQATKLINAIILLDKNGKLTQEISNSIITLLKAYK
jgi:transcriptional regulator with XRE-family HTH domain